MHRVHGGKSRSEMLLHLHRDLVPLLRRATQPAFPQGFMPSFRILWADQLDTETRMSSVGPLRNPNHIPDDELQHVSSESRDYVEQLGVDQICVIFQDGDGLGRERTLVFAHYVNPVTWH